VLRELNEDQRVVYVLVHGYGLSVAEAARVLEVSVNTLYSRLRLAQQRIDRAGIVVDCRHDEGEAQRASGRVLAAVLVQVRGEPAAVLGSGLAYAIGIALLSVLATGVLFAGYRWTSPGVGSTTRVSTTAVVYARVEGMIASSEIGASAEGLRSASGGVLRGAGRVAEPEVAEARVADAGVASPVIARPSPRAAVARPADASPSLAVARVARPVESSSASHEADPRPPTIEPDPELDRIADEIAEKAKAREHRGAWGTDRPEDAPATAPPTLDRETALLRRAKAALKQGNPDDALGLVARYERAFPKGTLHDVASRLRIEALCESGRTAQARREARASKRRDPDSPLAEAGAPCR
jgi:hypothetical protein